MKTRRFFLNSLPKAGTNLLSRAFDLSGLKYGRLGIAGTMVLGDCYLPRQLLRRSLFEKDPIIVGLETQLPVRRSWLARRLASVAPGGYVTGHANWSMGLENLLVEQRYQTVLLIRDPADVLLSHSHYVADSETHFLNKTYSQLALDARIRQTLKGGRVDGLDISPFLNVLNMLDAWRCRSDVHLVRFEDLVGVQGGGDAKRQARVFEALSELTGVHFDSERLNNELFGGSHTFRRGQIGSARSELSSSLYQEVVSKLEPIRSEWGYCD